MTNLITANSYQTIKTLKSLSIPAVANLAVHYVDTLSIATKITVRDAIFVISPFEPLTNNCIQEIIDDLTERNKLNLATLSVLLHTRITSLDLTSVREHNKNLLKKTLFYMLSNRCTDLLHFTLPFSKSSRLDPDTNELTAYLELHPSLLTLNLQRFKLADDLFPVLSDKSRHLTALNLASSSLSDAGLISISTLLNPFPNLITLNISRTRITSRGLHICLQFCTSLEILDASYLDLTLQMVNFPTSNLNSLTLEGTELDQDNFKQLLLSSRKLRNVTVCNNLPPFLSEECIQYVFSSLPAIETLTTRNLRLNLNTLSHNLTSLSLTLLDNPIDANYLCNNFSSLEELMLDDCKIIHGGDSPGLVHSMPRLTNLCLVRTSYSLTSYNILEGEELMVFLGSLDRLKNLDLTHSEIYPNHLDILLAKTNTFVLESLNLQSCYRVDGEIVDFIESVITKRQGRCEIDIRYCFNVHRNTLLDLARKLNSENIKHGVTVCWA